MDMAGEGKQVEPVARITDERIKQVVTILKDAQQERPLARERLVALAQELDRLLGEIGMFDRVVYCGQAAACLLDNGVLRMLAGSVIWTNRYREQTRISKDIFWNKPSPAACAALRRSSANGWEEWKYRDGQSLKKGRQSR